MVKFWESTFREVHLLKYKFEVPLLYLSSFLLDSELIHSSLFFFCLFLFSLCDVFDGLCLHLLLNGDNVGKII